MELMDVVINVGAGVVLAIIATTTIFDPKLAQGQTLVHLDRRVQCASRLYRRDCCERFAGPLLRVPSS